MQMTLNKRLCQTTVDLVHTIILHQQQQRWRGEVVCGIDGARKERRRSPPLNNRRYRLGWPVMGWSRLRQFCPRASMNIRYLVVGIRHAKKRVVTAPTDIDCFTQGNRALYLRDRNAGVAAA